jgi:TadE-like protein
MRRLMKVAAAAAGTVGLAVAVGLAIGGTDFLRQHFGALAVAAAFVVALGTVAARLTGGLFRGAVLTVRRPQALGQSGAVATEFVIVVIPFLLTLFGVMQMAMASMARVLVSYSAFSAARAAIVFVPADPKQVDSFGGQLKQSATTELAGNVGAGSNTRTDFTISRKAALLRNAAAYSLIAASPAIDTVVQDTINNWPAYWAGRVAHGLSPLDWIKATGADLSAYPQAVVNDFTTQLQQAMQNVLDGKESKDGAKKKLDSWIDKLNVSQSQKDYLKKGAGDYIDKYKGAPDMPTGQAGTWVQNLINDTLNGPLSKFHDAVSGAVAGAASGLGGSAGSSFKGSSVDRALDSGFGSGTDGPEGAMMRSLRKLIYSRMATVVTLVDESGAIKTHFEATEPIKARVTYLFYCQIPMVNKLAGKAFYNLPDQTVMDLTTGPLGPAAAVGMPGYFMTLTAEHVMTNQGKP